MICHIHKLHHRFSPHQTICTYADGYVHTQMGTYRYYEIYMCVITDFGPTHCFPNNSEQTITYIYVHILRWFVYVTGILRFYATQYFPYEVTYLDEYVNVLCFDMHTPTHTHTYTHTRTHTHWHTQDLQHALRLRASSKSNARLL